MMVTMGNTIFSFLLLHIVGLTTPRGIVIISTPQRVNISCQMIGYLRSNAAIKWKINDTDITSSDSNFTISTTTGDPNVAIGINGELTNGNISVLIILNGDTGTYTCEIPDTNVKRSITVSIGESVVVLREYFTIQY